MLCSNAGAVLLRVRMWARRYDAFGFGTEPQHQHETKSAHLEEPRDADTDEDA